MTRHMHSLAAIAVSVPVLALGTAAWSSEDPNVISECDVFIEINATDGDAGWQGILDGSPWKVVKVKGPGEDDEDEVETMLVVRARENAKDQGMTEYRWESAEPPFEEFSLEDFLERFPAGEYECQFRFIAGHPRAAEEEDELTHVLPAGPAITMPTADGESLGDVENNDYAVTWNAVTTQVGGGPLPASPPDDEIVKYVVTAETDDKVLTFEVLPPDTTVTIPAGTFECGDEGKIEIGATVESGNSTFTERPFTTC